MRPACCHSRRLSESRMRDNLTYGLMRGRRKRAVGLLDRDTHPKGEKRPGVAGPATVPRRCPTLRLLNVLDKLPLTRQAEARSLLTKIPYAETREEAERHDVNDNVIAISGVEACCQTPSLEQHHSRMELATT